MIAFVVYAVAVWVFAAKWRRRWGGFAIAGAGLLGVAFVGWLHILLNKWTDGRIYLPVLQSILYPYGVLVGAVAVFIAFLPRKPIGDRRCGACGYDISTLPGAERMCPECGTMNKPENGDLQSSRVCAACGGKLHRLRWSKVCERCEKRPSSGG